jgi:hypothetical protein
MQFAMYGFFILQNGKHEKWKVFLSFIKVIVTHPVPLISAVALAYLNSLYIKQV